MSVYVERLIRAPIDAVWTHTQEPDLHQRWDLRFTAIDYLPRPTAVAPQQFRYATRLALGLEVRGEGESIGARDTVAGDRTSALRFWSDQARSLIREGRGYWRYVPTSDGVQFLTSFDYDTRYGIVGRAIDRAAFRPLIGWATAWSFDRLRLWLEDGIEPVRAARQALVHGIARVGLALIFTYHGLVPKLLGPHPDEVLLLSRTGLSTTSVGAAIVLIGAAELLLAALMLARWHRAWPTAVAGIFAIVATIGVGISAPETLGGAFGPLTLNLAVLCLAAVDILTLDGIPSAGRCARRPAGKASP